jgi:myxalamid-type polyketide synthase MxaB
VHQAPLWGLGRVLALEGHGIDCRLVDLDPAAAGDEQLDALLAELAAADGEPEAGYRGGVRHVPRLERIGTPDASPDAPVEPPSGPYRVAIGAYGTLEELCFEPLERRPPGAGEIEIEVVASGLNFRDVLHALGMLQEASEELGVDSAAAMPFGFECSGVVSAVGAGVRSARRSWRWRGAGWPASSPSPPSWRSPARRASTRSRPRRSRSPT